MGGDWWSRGREFESWHRILDGSFFAFICCKIVLLFEKTEKMKKRPRMAHFQRDSLVKEKSRVTVDRFRIVLGEIWSPNFFGASFFVNRSSYRYLAFKKWTNPASFCLFSYFSNTNFTEKTVGFSGIRTRIVGVVGKHPDHLTTTTAQWH